jgi:hypothetical protein
MPLLIVPASRLFGRFGVRLRGFDLSHFKHRIQFGSFASIFLPSAAPLWAPRDVRLLRNKAALFRSGTDLGLSLRNSEEEAAARRSR